VGGGRVDIINLKNSMEQERKKEKGESGGSEGSVISVVSDAHTLRNNQVPGRLEELSSSTRAMKAIVQGRTAKKGA